MKARELRIGNYITTSYMTSIVFEVTEIREFYCFFKNIPSDISQYFDSNTIYPYIKPIELTEEWLLKFGFTKDDNILVRSFRKAIVNNALCLKELIINLDCMNQYIFIKESSFGKDKRQDVITLFNQDLSNHPIYVHQLQNLYFALTCEELKDC